MSFGKEFNLSTYQLALNPVFLKKKLVLLILFIFWVKKSGIHCVNCKMNFAFLWEVRNKLLFEQYILFIYVKEIYMVPLGIEGSCYSTVDLAFTGKQALSISEYFSTSLSQKSL